MVREERTGGRRRRTSRLTCVVGVGPGGEDYEARKSKAEEGVAVKLDYDPI